MEYNPMAPSVEKEMRVTRDKLASFVGSGKVEVLATPMVVMLMEKAACELAQEFIEDTKTTVGTKININHTAPTAEGMTLHARTKTAEPSVSLCRHGTKRVLSPKGNTSGWQFRSAALP